MIGFIIALLSGALMSVQGVFNTQVTKTTGMWVSNGWVQLTAFLVCVGAWLITGRDSIATLAKVEPKYVLIVTAQLLVSYLIELFGLFGMDKEPFEWRKLLGLGVAVIGITIFQWK